MKYDRYDLRNDGLPRVGWLTLTFIISMAFWAAVVLIFLRF